MTWKPHRTLQETEVLLRAPGCIHEVETTLVDGRLYRVYKNLWPSLRDFWLSAVSQYSTDIYIVYEDQRLTYGQVHNRIIQVAASFYQLYGVKKGDRVGICSRNCPDYLVAFWACHLIGAVSVLVNGWLPPQPLRHCLVHTECKLIILDPERASSLETTVSNISEATGGTKFLVMDTTDRTRRWQGMEFFNDAVDLFPDVKDGYTKAPTQGMDPEDDATIIFTSGTTGLPKGVLSTQRQFLTNVLNVLAGGCRAALRRGETLSVAQRGGLQKAILISVPLFHVTGSTSFSMIATMTGMKIVLMRKWEVEEAAKLIKRENVAVAGGVPAMVSDLSDSSLVGHPLEGLLFGGAPAPDSLVPRARKAFPTATMIQGYGLTETNSIAVSLAGEDYIARPSSTGLASPVNDIMILWNGVALPHHSVGEVWLRGPNVMKGYWRDPEATNKVITTDGWFKTGDLGYLDEENFLFIKDRLKDVIIRGGENIDSVSVENALYSDDRILEAAAVGVPDERLGELVAAVVSIKPAFRGQVTEAGLILQAQKSLPKFAVPVMVVIVDHELERTPSGKIVKGPARKLARRHWEDRSQSRIISSNL